jgi:hypothetical protein
VRKPIDVLVPHVKCESVIHTKVEECEIMQDTGRGYNSYLKVSDTSVVPTYRERFPKYTHST